MTRRRTRRTRRPPLLAAVALFASLLATFAPGAAAPTLAAGPGMTIVSNATYTVDPDKGAVHVSVLLTAVNHLEDTKTRLYYFDRAFLAVPPNTSGFRISAQSTKPAVRVASKKADHTLLRIDFGSRLPAGSSRGMLLTFDITDPGGVPTRTTRIGPSLVAFGAWAYASDATAGSTVTVVFPAGYTIDARSDLLGKPTTNDAGQTVFKTARLAKPLTFFAYFVADRPSAFTETKRSVVVDGRALPITIRSWPDDPAWAERTAGLVEQGLPVLAEAIGLPWIADRPFIVQEAVSQAGSAYAGRYNPDDATVEIAYYADPLVTLHEMAHAWFDGGLLADRWVNEGFASWYAREAAVRLGLEVPTAGITPEQQAARLPLNAWGPLGRNEAPTEAYGYAASAELARLIAERAGPTGLASVWEAARSNIAAYQPPGLGAPTEAMPGTTMAGASADSDAAATEMGAGPPDWRGLLDLLEDRTGPKYDDLWRAWVIRPDETGLLDQRGAARRQYDELVSRAGEWRLPPLVREAMRAWQFDQATELLVAADRALDDRDEVAARASAAGLEVPRALRAAFEGDRGFAAASSEAESELATIRAFSAAVAAREVEPGIVEQIGLWGTTPELDIERAAESFAAGDLRASVEASAAAFDAWSGARETGRDRVMSMLAAAIAAIVAVAFVVNGVRSMVARRSSRTGGSGRAGRSGRSGGSGSTDSRRRMAHPAD